MNIKFLEVKRAYYADPENVVVEVRAPAGVWAQCINEPAWDSSFDYRIRPRTIRIGDIDVPEPVGHAEFMDGDFLYICNPFSADDCKRIVFEAKNRDHIRWVSRGFAHRSMSSAIEHAKALIIVSGGKV